MKYVISIPEPCDEKWDEMTPTEQGRFCNVCAKDIYDFTQISNRELVNKLKNNENICARYRKDQLDINLYANSNTGLSRMGLLLSLTSLFALSQPALAQGEAKLINTEQQSQVDIKVLKKVKTSKKNTITIRGTVFDKVIGPVPLASVFISGTNIRTQTDIKGRFKLIVSKSEVLVGTELIASMYGNSTSILLNKLNKKVHFILDLNKVTVPLVLGKVNVKISELLIKDSLLEKKEDFIKNNKKWKRPFFTRIANLFRKKENKH